MIFLKKNTRKYIFFKLSEKMVFSKRATPGHYLSCIIWNDGIFFPENLILFLRQEASDDLSQETHGNMIFLFIRTGVTNLVSCPSAKKNQSWPYPAKVHLKVIDVLD